MVNKNKSVATMQHPQKDGSKLGPGLYLPAEIGQIPIGLLPYSTLFITEAVPAIYFRPQKPERISVILCYAEYVRKPLACRAGRCPGHAGEWLARMDSWPARMDSWPARAAGSLTSAGHLIPESGRGLMPVLVRSQLLRRISSS